MRRRAFGSPFDVSRKLHAENQAAHAAPATRQRVNRSRNGKMTTVDHVFVLMLENRSFDHFFGLSNIPSVRRPVDPGFGPGATDRAPYDPPHEFEDVQKQI